MQIITSCDFVLNKCFSSEIKGGEVYFLHWLNKKGSPNFRITCALFYSRQEYTQHRHLAVSCTEKYGEISSLCKVDHSGLGRQN